MDVDFAKEKLHICTVLVNARIVSVLDVLVHVTMVPLPFALRDCAELPNRQELPDHNTFPSKRSD
jgi:hypothetical protein